MGCAMVLVYGFAGLATLGALLIMSSSDLETPAWILPASVVVTAIASCWLILPAVFTQLWCWLRGLPLRTLTQSKLSRTFWAFMVAGFAFARSAALLLCNYGGGRNGWVVQSYLWAAMQVSVLSMSIELINSHHRGLLVLVTIVLPAVKIGAIVFAPNTDAASPGQAHSCVALTAGNDLEQLLSLVFNCMFCTIAITCVYMIAHKTQRARDHHKRGTTVRNLVVPEDENGSTLAGELRHLRQSPEACKAATKLQTVVRCHQARIAVAALDGNFKLQCLVGIFVPICVAEMWAYILLSDNESSQVQQVVYMFELVLKSFAVFAIFGLFGFSTLWVPFFGPLRRFANAIGESAFVRRIGGAFSDSMLSVDSFERERQLGIIAAALAGQRRRLWQSPEARNAATKLQTAVRGHQARTAVAALDGNVKLQGQVRRGSVVISAEHASEASELIATTY
jgi:hypothetical protein